MSQRSIVGLAPYLLHHRPRAAARWWIATGAAEADRLRIAQVEESDRLPGRSGGAGALFEPRTLLGLAAPCTLPAPFLDHLGISGDRDAVLRALESCTAERLGKEVRRFAARRRRGDRYPRRNPAETASALERHRLPLFRAAVPLLRARADVHEIDVEAFLNGRGLPASSLGGTRPAAVRARASIVDALAECEIETHARDCAIASIDALHAVIAACALVQS